MKHKKIITIYLFIFFVLLFLKSFSQLQYHYWSCKPENKKIKEKTIWYFKFDTNEKTDTLIDGLFEPLPNRFQQNDSILLSKQFFNDKGLVIYEECNQMHIDYFRYSSKHYKWDSKNRQIEQLEYGKDSSWFEVYKTDFDDVNKIVQIDHFYNSTLIDYKIYKYNKKGNLLLASEYSSDEHLDSKSLLEYSLNDRLVNIKRFSYYKDTTICTSTVSYLLDRNDLILESSYYDGLDSSFNRHYLNKYNKKGNLIQCDIEMVVNDSMKKMIEIYRYNSNDKLVTSKDIRNNREVLRKNNFYMKNGLLEYENEYTENGTLYCKYKYKYKLRK